MQGYQTILSGIGGGAIALFSFTIAQASPLTQPVQDVISHLVGVMDISAQAAQNPDLPNVRMTTCEVPTQDIPHPVLYQEQAVVQRLHQPYRQRFLQIIPSPDGETIESKSFKPLNPEMWVGFCNQTPPQRFLTPQDLGETVCSVFLQPVGENYVGETPPEGCPTNVRGAVTITNRIILHEQGMDTWDRGFDAQGNQVWGAEGESYQFRWVK